MMEPVELVTALVWGGAVGALSTLMLGVRRIPWRYAALAGAGWGIVFAALRAAAVGGDPSTLVLLGAIGGSLAIRGSDRGEQARRRISDEITAIRAAPPV